jgi:hypothetical protein
MDKKFMEWKNNKKTLRNQISVRAKNKTAGPEFDVLNSS